jgi:hypothetical protein
MGHYLDLHITVVSVALALAGGAAASLIARHSISAADLSLLWLLWLGSVLATAVAYAGTMVGAFALPSGIPDISDLVLPLLMCVTEFLLFAVLIRQVTSFASLSDLVDTWLVLMAAFGAVAVLSITKARRHFTAVAGSATSYRTVAPTRSSPYSQTAASLIRQYTIYLDRDRIGATATCAASAIGVIVRFAGATAEPVAYIFALLVIALLAVGLHGHGQTARMWRHSLYQGPDRRAARGSAESGIPIRDSDQARQRRETPAIEQPHESGHPAAGPTTERPVREDPLAP